MELVADPFVGDVLAFGGQCVARRGLGVAAFVQPLRRAPVQLALLCRRELGEQAAERLPGERVHAQPLTVFANGQDRRRCSQALEQCVDVVAAGHRPEQLGVQCVEDRGGHQQVGMRRRKLREQRFGEEVLDVRQFARDRGKIERRVVLEHRGDQQ